MDTYNWLNYKIEIQGSFSEDTLKVVITDQSPKTNEFIDKAVNFSWMDFVKGRKSVDMEAWDSTVYSLMSYKVSGSELEIRLGKTSYKRLQGTNASNWILGDVFGEEYLANGILVQSIVITSDNYLVLGKRNSGVKEGLETQAIFGGTIDENELVVNNSKDFFQGIRKELNEELGVENNQIEFLTLNALFRDWKKYPVFMFVTKLNLTKDQLLHIFDKKGDKEEHTGLEFYTSESLFQRLKAEQERFNDLTLASFDIYFKESFTA